MGKFLEALATMVEDREDYSKYDDDTNYDVDSVTDTNITINPSFYIHHAVVKAQKALIKDNVKDGFLQYRILVDHLEIICESAKMLPENYSKIIEDWEKEHSEEKEAKDAWSYGVKKAHFKLKTLMGEVFSSNVSTNPMKM